MSGHSGQPDKLLLHRPGDEHALSPTPQRGGCDSRPTATRSYRAVPWLVNEIEHVGSAAVAGLHAKLVIETNELRVQIKADACTARPRFGQQPLRQHDAFANHLRVPRRLAERWLQPVMANGNRNQRPRWSTS
jgi:hypothetical protein